MPPDIVREFIIMNKNDCFFEKVWHFGVAMALLFVAMGFSVIGGAVLPFFGLAAAATIFVLSAYFLLAPRNQECAIR
jgi:hypothetical protein